VSIAAMDPELHHADDPWCPCAACAAAVAAFLADLAAAPPLVITHYSDFPHVERITVVTFDVAPDAPPDSADVTRQQGGLA
jgi:hypothetical protein